jgi:hypothetical protein
VRGFAGTVEKRGYDRMPFTIEITPRKDSATEATVHVVVVTIDGHETVLNFQSKEDAEAFAQTERARLTADAPANLPYSASRPTVRQ